MLTGWFDHSGQQRVDRESSQDAQGTRWWVQTSWYPGCVWVAIVTSGQQKTEGGPSKRINGCPR